VAVFAYIHEIATLLQAPKLLDILHPVSTEQSEIAEMAQLLLQQRQFVQVSCPCTRSWPKVSEVAQGTGHYEWMVMKRLGEFLRSSEGEEHLKKYYDKAMRANEEVR
jgi:hypothetical protein